MTQPSNSTLQPQVVPAVSDQFRLQYEEAQNSWVLLYPEGMVKLSESAGEILKRCDGEKPISAIITSLEEAFDEKDLTADVLGFLDVALQQKWISTTDIT